jgi:hypothetical protein
MQGFSMPWSTKRTAGLQSPSPIGQQSCCSILPGSLPLKPLTPQALLGPSSVWDNQIHTLPGSPPLKPCWTPIPRKTAASTAPPGSPPRGPHPSGPARPQLHWDNQSHALLGSPPLQPARHQLHMRQLHPHPTGIPIPQTLLDICPIKNPHPLGGTGPSSIGLPDNHCTRLPHRPPQEGSNLLKRHRQIGLDAKGETSEQLRLQFYCSRTGDFFFPFFKGLVIWFADWSPTISPIFSLF